MSALSQEQLRRFLDSIPAVLYLAIPLGPRCTGGKLAFVSRKIESLTGYQPEQLLTDTELWTDLIHPDDRDKVLAAYSNCSRQAKAFEAQYRIMHKDGSARHVHNIAEPVFNDRGEVTRIAGIVTDISPRKRAEQELSRTQMLQSIGRLSAGIAHEINTPIQFIGDNMQFLSDSFGKLNLLLKRYSSLHEADQRGQISQELVQGLFQAEQEVELEFLQNEIPKAIRQSLDGIRRVTTIVAAMRDFCHLDERRKVAADLNKALQSTLVILRNELKYIADVQTHFDPNLPKVMCYLDDLHQVFLNLMINAIHSIAEVVAAGNTVRCPAENDRPASGRRSERGLITVSTKLKGDEVVIKIADTGAGIPPENRTKIFDSFFTTKTPGKGTGQGLSIARSIVVDKHGGTLHFDTEVAVGTTFTIRLPILGDSRRKTRSP